MTRKRKRTFDLTTDQGLCALARAATEMQEEGGHPIASLENRKARRSRDQNSMIYALYAQISAQVEDQSPLEVRNECKLLYGVPILARDHVVFQEFAQDALYNLSYETQLQAVQWIDVSSIMTKEQGTEYIDTILRTYSQQGIALADPRQVESY